MDTLYITSKGWGFGFRLKLESRVGMGLQPTSCSTLDVIANLEKLSLTTTG